MKIEIRIDRNVCESVIIDIENEEQLKELVKNDELFDQIDYQGKKFEEDCGEILFTEIAILDDNDNDIKTFKINNEDKLVERTEE